MSIEMKYLTCTAYPLGSTKDVVTGRVYQDKEGSFTYSATISDDTGNLVTILNANHNQLLALRSIIDSMLKYVYSANTTSDNHKPVSG